MSHQYIFTTCTISTDHLLQLSFHFIDGHEIQSFGRRCCAYLFHWCRTLSGSYFGTCFAPRLRGIQFPPPTIVATEANVVRRKYVSTIYWDKHSPSVVVRLT